MGQKPIITKIAKVGTGMISQSAIWALRPPLGGPSRPPCLLDGPPDQLATGPPEELVVSCRAEVSHPAMITWRLALILGLVDYGLGARILAFLPFPAVSHHIAFQPMLVELAKRGHQVDYVTAVPIKEPPKTLRHIKIKDLLADLHGQMKMELMMKMSVPASTAIISEMGLYVATKLFEEEPEMPKLLATKEKYDAVILETHFGQEYSSAFCHKFNAACISLVPLFDSTWVNEMSGLPDNPSYMIDFKATTTDKLTFFEKLRNVYIWTTSIALGYYYLLIRQQQVADKFLRYDGWESRPSVAKMASDMDLILINSHHSFGYPYPKAPHVKEVGGMNLAPSNNPLPKDLQTFMDSATHGVIYFSYGSNVDISEMMASGKFEAFVNTFKKLKQKVLWKWKGSEIPKVDALNVRIQEWFPQQDVLAHKNMKLFVTHGGLMSLIEAIYNSVPLLGTAVFGDQPKNLKFVEHAGIGIELKFDNLTESSIFWAINEIMSNPRYKENMKKRTDLFKDRPMKPADEAAYWIEYVMKHGKVLQPASAKMPFYQLYLLDVMAAVALAVIVTLWTVKKLFGALCSHCCGSKQKSVNSAKKKQ